MNIITVTNNANWGRGSLRQAIKKAQSGDTIQFDNSLANQTITLGSFIGIQKSLIIDGSDAPGLTISGGEKTNLFRLAKENESLTVRNLTLADSYYRATAGGAIWAINNSTIDIENVNFLNNVSDGAALHGQAGSVITVTNSNFDGNDGAKISDKSYSAGAISLFAYGSLTIEDSVFTDNKGFGGGALRVTSSDLIIEDSVFVGNDSTAGADKAFVPIPGGGGAIYLDAASVPNESRFYEGGLQGETEGGIFKVSNSRFEKNRGAGQGGAIMAWGYNQDRIIIEDSKIINNEVIKNRAGIAQGGGLWLMGYGEVDNTTIANNKSTKNGGGVYVWGETPTTISNSDFSGNQAVNGGAIYDALWGSRIDIDNTTFDSNSATNKAGVFYSKNNRPFSLQDSQFSNNTPDDLSNVNFNDDVPNILYGSNGSNNISETDRDSYLAGLKGNDKLEGLGGNDYLDGGANNDVLKGGVGNDTLVGGTQKNYLFGGDGDDIFIGGKGQDLMEGGKGRDRYIIGDEDRVFYTNYTWYDHAIIKDFEFTEDTIQLKGQASDYTIKPANSQGIRGTGIFYEDGMVALVGGVSPKNFSLNADYVDYGTPISDSDTLIDSGKSSGSGLELKQDSLFSNKPNYNPSEHNGLIVWNTGNAWHIEATGDGDGSNFTGQITASNPIENLSPYSLESNDTVEFTDNSRQIIEFDLNVWNQWRDGISFEVSDNASVFLELEDSSNISVKAGANLQEINL